MKGLHVKPHGNGTTADAYLEGRLLIKGRAFDVLEHMMAYPFNLFELIPDTKTDDPTAYSPEMFKAFVSSHGPSEVEYISPSAHDLPLQRVDYWDDFDPLFEDDDNEGAKFMSNIVRKQFAEVARRIATYTSSKDLFFIGCSNGKMFDIFQEHGFSCSGIEPNEYTSAIARENGRDVTTASIDSHVCNSPHSVVVELGVLSATVTPRSYAKHALSRIKAFLSPGGLYVHSPFTRSHLRTQMLTQIGFEVLAKSIPRNLFDPLKYPKQFYVGKLQ